MTDEVKNEPLEALRRRWDFEKTPKLTLQLAEEYGRREDYLEAIMVLRAGLEAHPRHVASRVLLGRYLVELEQWREARGLLEKVAAEDPAHLLANKMLVEIHLALGETSEARNRLDLYTLLNERDPDIETLEQRLAGEVPPEALPVAEPAATEEEADGAEASAAAPAASEPPPPAPVATPRFADEPFGDLWGGGTRDRVLDALGSGGIFDLPRPAAVPALAVAEAPAEELEPEPEEAAVVEDAEPAPAPPPAATFTLGQLYLEQGHREEAASTFAEVLEGDAGNVAARVGLAAARASKEWPLTALDLVPREVLEEADREERRRALLSGYLARLRGAGSSPSKG